MLNDIPIDRADKRRPKECSYAVQQVCACILPPIDRGIYHQYVEWTHPGFWMLSKMNTCLSWLVYRHWVNEHVLDQISEVWIASEAIAACYPNATYAFLNCSLNVPVGKCIIDDDGST